MKNSPQVTVEMIQAAAQQTVNTVDERVKQLLNIGIPVQVINHTRSEGPLIVSEPRLTEFIESECFATPTQHPAYSLILEAMGIQNEGNVSLEAHIITDPQGSMRYRCFLPARKYFQ